MMEGDKKIDVSAVCGYVARKGGLAAAYLNGETLGQGNRLVEDGDALFRVASVEGFTSENFLVLLGMEAEEKGCKVRDITSFVVGEEEGEEESDGKYRYIAVNGVARERLEAALASVMEK